MAWQYSSDGDWRSDFRHRKGAYRFCSATREPLDYTGRVCLAPLLEQSLSSGEDADAPSVLESYRKAAVLRLQADSLSRVNSLITTLPGLISISLIFPIHIEMEQAQGADGGADVAAATRGRSSLLHPTRHSGGQGPGSIDCEGPAVYRSRSTVRTPFPFSRIGSANTNWIIDPCMISVIISPEADSPHFSWINLDLHLLVVGRNEEAVMARTSYLTVDVLRRTRCGSFPHTRPHG
jgi:hypothetical protein